MSLKKSLSVFLAAVMLLCCCSAGITGAAAVVDDSTRYRLLAQALENEYVRDLSNYTITNTSPERDNDTFNTEANGFVYEHRVTAADNTAGDILRAANIFYYIAEKLIANDANAMFPDGEAIVNYVVSMIKDYFGGTDTYYEDFYGSRYEPSEEELAAYAEAKWLIETTGGTLSEASLTPYNVYFIEKNKFEYYNVKTVLQYFMGNVLKINAGNWYHRFVFVDRTSIDTVLKENGSINEYNDENLVTYLGVYEFKYKRTFNDIGTKAYYSFEAPSLRDVYSDYNQEFSFKSNVSDDLSNERNGLTTSGQASCFMINKIVDSTTIPYLRTIYNCFAPYVNANPVITDGKITSVWDSRFAKMTDDQLKAFVIREASADEPVVKYDTLIGYIDDLTSTYSNAALLSMFGDSIGNMMTFTYIMKPISDLPERTVRGTSKYTVTADKLNTIIHDIDNLIYSPTSDTAQRVGTIVSQFFNTNASLFEGTSVEGLGYTNLKELVNHLVVGLVFNDSIINTLVGLLYPLVADLITDKLIDGIRDKAGSLLSGLVGDLLNDIIVNNALAVFPNQLADRLNSQYGSKYDDAEIVLRAAGDNWDNVNMDALHWGVDEASYSDKGDAFIDALCAALGGFRLLVITIMCGDAEYKNDNRKRNLSWASTNQFTEYYDKLVVNIGQQGVLLRSQGGYTKLIIPLLRVLGLQEQTNYGGEIYGYLSSREYHRLVDLDGDNCLRMILKPIVYWVTNYLAQKPFETLWNLLPNLVYFFIRTSDVAIADDWTDTTSNDDTHDNFTTCQTHSLAEIMDHVHITATLIGFKVYDSTIAGFLGDKMDMLSTVNGLLDSVLDLTYRQNKTGVMLPVAYASSNAPGAAIVGVNSIEYVENPGAYPIALTEVYTNETETAYSIDETEECYIFVDNPEYLKAPYRLPVIQEKKLTSVTTLEADGVTLRDPNAIGILNSAWNTIDVRNPGVVLLYVLRFVCSALGYRYDASSEYENDNHETVKMPSLIECFGLDLKQELFQGLSLGDIIYNVMLHPDEAICALLELFYSNEHESNYYEYIRGNVSKQYAYPVKPIDYHGAVLLNEGINPTRTYGTQVTYSKYWTREYANDVVANSGQLAQNILTMCGFTEFADGFGAYIKNLLDENVFNNKLINKLFNAIYKLLGGLNDTIGFDIETVLDAALNITYNSQIVGNTVRKMMGYATPASTVLSNGIEWTALFADGDVELDWGIDDAEAHGLSRQEAFVKTAAALLSPAGLIIKYLFADKNLNILGLIELDGYAGYQFAFIGLLEALSCPGILTYEKYYEKTLETESGTLLGDANAIYYLFSPLLGLIDEVYADPITKLLSIIPNLLFFVSIGGLNDLLNNLVHFAYVLLDILKPIVNGYDLLGGLISNIEIKGVQINLSLPLDIDFNALISDLVGGLVGDALTIEGVSIALPYIDFHTLCCGTLESFSSKEMRDTVYLNAAGGGDLITAVLRLLFEVIFMDENRTAVSNIISNAINKDEEKVDSYDKETILQIYNLLCDVMLQYEIPDILLFAIYFLVTKLTPITGKIAPLFAAKGLTIQGLFANISNPSDFLATISLLTSSDEGGGSILGGDPPGDEITNIKAGMSILDRIKAFFARIAAFFQKLFHIG